MRNRKAYITRILLPLCGLVALLAANPLHGQRDPQYTQYMFNDFVINPAVAGVHNYYQIRTNHRFHAIYTDEPIIACSPDSRTVEDNRNPPRAY